MMNIFQKGTGHDGRRKYRNRNRWIYRYMQHRWVNKEVEEMSDEPWWPVQMACEMMGYDALFDAPEGEWDKIFKLADELEGGT